MRKLRRPGGAAIGAVVLVLALVGCGSGTATEATPSEETSTPATTTTSEAAAPKVQPSGRHYTIVDYIRDTRIVETRVHPGDPGAPTIKLPFPPGWKDAGARTPKWAWGAIYFADPAMAAAPPGIVALVSKLTGNVLPARILWYAPGELKNLPYFDGGDGSASKLSGFDAWQISGTYTSDDGVKRAIAQKTVVIPVQDGLYVMQFNAEGLADQMKLLMDAMGVIDEQTTITP
jgi:hypothetical protein